MMGDEPVGRVIGIARRLRHRAPMEELAEAELTPAAGVTGDSRGAKYQTRQVTVLALEDWQAALAALAARDGGPAPDLAWTIRRANVLVAGVRLPVAKGGILAVGPAVLEVTGVTWPCARMDEARPGLLKALAGASRGGVTTRVLEGGPLRLGDPVEVRLRPVVRTMRLPG